MRRKILLVFVIALIMAFAISSVLGQKKKSPTKISPKKSQKSQSVTKKRISGCINHGSNKAINLARPEYPPPARWVCAAGTVNISVLIDENGDVLSANAVSGHPVLRAAAVRAALKSKFQPTFLSGIPVKVCGTIVYDFIP
jgi:TonB family protein